MDAVEVDIELFVTCRLCLNEKGTYQIIPSVQQQIKYCFDINIDTFDGLPQLLCKKCKDILNDYHAIKTKYRDIQDTLKDKLQKKPPVTSIEPSEVEKEANNTNRVEHTIEERSSKEKKIKHRKIRKKKLEVRKKRILSFSSSSSENPEPLEFFNSLTHVNKKRENTSQVGNDVRYTWEENYTKYFVCHICKKECKEVCDIETHIKTHNDLFMRHLNFFETKCKINLNKINETSNLTGLCTAVVHDEGLIVRYLDDFHYYIVYKNEEKLNVGYKRSPETCSRPNDSYNDSDRYDHTFRTKRKKCRLDSKSSNETVIIDNDITAQCASDDSVDVSVNGNNLKDDEPTVNGNNLKDDEPLVNEAPFIVLDDTSTDSLCANETHPTNDIERENLNYKTIKEVVGKTYNYLVSQDSNKYKKYKNNQIEHSKSYLKHKILSTGIKVITKQGFPCTGILRFLKEKKLEVKWKPRIRVNVVNVRTYLKEIPIVLDLWKNVAKSNLCKLESGKTNDCVQNVKDSENVRIDAMTADDKDSHVDVDKCVTDGVERVNVHPKKSLDILTTNKLLNSNPVINPKQLPKKSMDVQKSNTEHKVEQKFVEKNTVTVQNEAVCIDLIDDAENVDFNQVPIIISKNSSVTSDKPEEVENRNNKTDNMPKQESVENCPTDLPKVAQSAPRIKVKSFSELLSNEAINIMNESSNPVPDNNMWQINQQPQISSVYQYQYQTTSQVVSDNSAVVGYISQPQNVPRQMPPNQLTDLSSTTSRTGFLVLHSKQMPKTITDSPFNYFRDLLRINNIILMQPNSTLSTAFKCVARLKLTVRQDEITKFLKLSLWCYKNFVCINVVDEHNNPIDVNMTSIEWQWEILQVFVSDAVSKMYLGVLNMSGEVYANITKFKNLLKSIKRHPM